jgi:allantoinase
MAEEPAKLAGCDSHKGRIAPGYDADLAIFEQDAEFVVVPERLYQRHPVSPYQGEKLLGIVKATYLRGKQVFHENTFPGPPIGREYPR